MTCTGFSLHRLLVVNTNLNHNAECIRQPPSPATLCAQKQRIRIHSADNKTISCAMCSTSIGYYGGSLNANTSFKMIIDNRTIEKSVFSSHRTTLAIQRIHRMESLVGLHRNESTIRGKAPRTNNVLLPTTSVLMMISFPCGWNTLHPVVLSWSKVWTTWISIPLNMQLPWS